MERARRKGEILFLATNGWEGGLGRVKAPGRKKVFGGKNFMLPQHTYRRTTDGTVETEKNR